MILTNQRPILSVGNPAGVQVSYSLDYELSSDPDFPEDNTLKYTEIEQTNKYISEFRVMPGDELEDGTYYWRARTHTADGDTSAWVKTRFYLDVENSRTFSGFLRAPVNDIKVSSGQDPKNIIDWNDQGQITYWNSTPSSGEPFSWVMLDMGQPTPVSRFWMLSTRNTTLAAGWLTHFVWQGSDDGKTWSNIEGTEIKNNDTYRNIIDFKAVNTRYYRLVIYSQNALQVQLNTIIPYTSSEPRIPDVPKDKYVLLIGNQMNGYTYTNLAKFVEDRGYKSITIPHFEMSLDVLRNLSNTPMAIIFSGNNADWQYLPMFEYYGEFEIYREVYDIPMMGICAGNEFYAMAYGMSFAHWMGWFDDTMFRLTEGETPAEVQILPEFVNDPIFKDVPNPFRAVEIHSWAISPISALFMQDERYSEFHVTSQTSYVQTIKSSERPAYSEQFHGGVINEYNQGGIYLANFLEIAEEYSKGK
jgi:anthranilate/para-aminobenzoate synthase component II